MTAFERGHLFTHQDLAKWVTDDRILGVSKSPEAMRELVKSASLDIQVGDEVYRVDRNLAASLKWEKDVRSALGNLAVGDVQRYDLRSGPVVARPGCSYIIPCKQSIKLPRWQAGDFTSVYTVYNSPKSTSARTFKNVRVFFEGRSRFDIVDNMRDDDVIVRPWILLDPNHSAYEIQKDSSLTQLRIGNGLDSKLTAREILDAHTGSISTNGYGIFNLFSNGKLVPLDNLERYIDQNNNVSLRLNLHSRDGVVKQEKIGIEQGVGYLVESVEYVCVPPNISLEMIQSTSGGLRVTTHKGGYFDPGFKGTVVGEVELADEQTNRCLHHKEQVFAFALQRHREPTTMPYGVGSNYQEQVGVQYAKYFAAKIDPKSVIGWQTRLGVDAVIGSVNGAQDVLDFFKPIR